VTWAEKVATSLGVKLVVVEVRGADYDRAFATIAAERAHALFVVDSAVLGADRARIIQLTATHRMPAIYGWRDDVEAGGLMAYGGSRSRSPSASRSISIGSSGAPTPPHYP
jgi:putative ABC transport system substrate-binding protein